MLISLTACAPAVHDYPSDTALPSLLRSETVAGVVTYSAVPELSGDTLTLAISEADRCSEIETPRKHRVTHVERKVNNTFVRAYWVVGVLFACTGIGTYFDADDIAAMRNQQSMSGMMTTPNHVRTTGIVEMTVGGLALAMAIGSYVRAIDSERDDGVIAGAPLRKEHACNPRPSRDTPALLDLGVQTLRRETDEQGQVRFALTSVSSQAVPQRGRPLSVVIGTSRIKIELADSELAELRRALETNPASQLAKELAAPSGR